jgi:hypothetical protein
MKEIVKENGFLNVLKVGTSNIYIINPNLIWTDYNSKKKSIKFDESFSFNYFIFAPKPKSPRIFASNKGFLGIL